MPPRNSLLITLLFAALALIVFALAGWVGGPRNLTDVDTIHQLAAGRAGTLGPSIAITQFGGAAILVLVLLMATAWLIFVRRWRPAICLCATVLGGRIAVELLKLAIDRPRPHFGDWPVPVASLSFPSGHAANSMITLLALAVFVAPQRWRLPAIVAAVAGSVAIGATRPILGVHWPSDVIGGWAFGIAWVILWVALCRRWIDSAQ